MNEPPDRVTVAIPGAEYPVFVGTGLLDHLADLVPLPAAAARAAVVTGGGAARYATPLAASLTGAGLDVTVVEVPDGESAKTLDTVAEIYRAFAAMPLNRSDLVVAVGGGVVGDMVGFAAATWNRGVPVVQVPTTLLAQVDAAIGGKTGVNLPAGKNLVGAFHQPHAVVADIDTLATLPPDQVRNGLGEVVKYGFIADPAILDRLAGTPDVDADLVTRCVRVKARVVAGDERESGLRAILNYGHTVGHALEALGGYDRPRHGEAVGLGMIVAARIGERVGISRPGLADRTVDVLAALGLPVTHPPVDPDRVWEMLRRDKKAQGGVRFVLVPEPGRAVLVDQPDPAVIDAAVASLAA